MIKSFNMPNTCMVIVIILSVLLLEIKIADAQDTKKTGTVFGTIIESDSSNPLMGASAVITILNKGTITDEKGNYKITDIPPGIYNVKFSMIGYETLIKTNISVSPGRDSEVNVKLVSEPIEIESVTVKAKETYFEKDPEAEVSGRTIDNQEIMNSAGGLMDVQRIVQVLPSVVSGSDQFNEIIVRGGNYGENLFVMDGIEIPNPNHFAAQGTGGGPISLLRTEFIQDVSFLAGAFPAKYGDKASSVMDITLRRGSRDKVLTNFDLGMAGAGFMAEGPVGEKGSFLVSARKSYLDLIISNYGITAIPRYYNLQGKLTYALGDYHTLMWNSVYGSDSIRIKPGEEEGSDENVDQQSDLSVTGFTLKSVFSKNLFGEGVLSFVRNKWSIDVWEEGFSRSEDFYNNRSIESETNLKYNLTMLLNKYEISGGFSLKNSRFNHDIFADGDTVFTYDTNFTQAENDTVTGIYRIYNAWNDDKNVNTLKSAAFAQLRMNPIPRLSLRFGGRYDYIAYTKHGYYSPRAGLRYMIKENLWLNGAYGIHYQSPAYILLTANEKNKNLGDYYTDQIVIGTEWLPRPDIRTTVEFYSKKYRDVPVSKAWTTPAPWDSDQGEMVNGAQGHSEGIEFYLQKKMSSSYMYILSYSFYRAWFKDPRSGEERPWDFDLRNVFTVSTAKRWNLSGSGWYNGIRNKFWFKALAWIVPLGDEVMFSAKWRFTGGKPFTDPEYLRENHVWIIPENMEYNADRVPDYNRLDIRIDRRFFFKNWSLVLYTDIMNVYGRKNIWDYSRNEFGEVEKVYQFSTMPVGGFSIEF